MNLHPIFVHFPIALLTVYALLELARFPFVKKHPSYFHVKAAFAIIGTLGAGVTYLSGQAIEDQFQNSVVFAHLVEVHAAWATGTVILFAFISLCYLLVWIDEGFPKLGQGTTKLARTYATAKVWAARYINSWFSLIFALVGLVAVTVTGALGGSIVYGPDIDPAVKLIYGVLIGK